MPITQRGAVIVASDGAASDSFGTSIALGASGTVLAVGAPQRDSGGAGNSGGVYIYDYSGGTWTQRGSVLTQSTPDANDKFGQSVALSANGLVLAVGAPEYWHDPDEYYGLVYVYDYTGGAWVLRGTVDINPANNVNFGAVIALSGDGLVLGVQDANTGHILLFDYTGGAWVQRGTSLENPGGLAGFGSSFAFSNDGTVAAVGCPGYILPATSAGAVAIFDYSGGVWTQRAALVQASDATLSDNFGSGVALSSTGAVLAVGAKFWEGDTGTDQGLVYVFDWSGTAWSQRDTAAAGDPANFDYFGSAVALSAAADIMAVGAPSWEGTNADQGGAYVFDITSGDVATAPTSLTVTLSSGTATAPTELTMVARAYAPTALTVVSPTGSASAPTELTMIGSGVVSAATLLAVIDATDATNWTARCLIDGVDVSARLVGQASVVAEEGAARIASVTLLPAAGAVTPLDYVGKPIVLDYVLVIGGVDVPRRLFTGRIDTPDYDPATTLLRLTCVDDLQNRVASLDRSVLDGLIGGQYTEAVQGAIDDNWDYAEALLTTVAGSMDAGPSGGMRLTPWEISSTWATFTESSLLYQRARLSLPQRSTMINSVSVAFDYRYAHLRQRFTSMGWSGTLLDMAPCGYQYPTQQDILGAASGSGWTPVLAKFYPAPAAIPYPGGGFIYPDEDAIDMAIIYLAQRHSQTVTENYTLTVTAPESVTLNGELPHALRGALASSFDGRAWESALDVAPHLPAIGGEAGVTFRHGEMDYAPDTDRTAADYAIDTLLMQARVKILGSHRGARVGNAILCNPDLDLDKKVAIDTAQVSAAGKVARVEHVLDFAAGSAVTEFDLAIFGAGGAGIITPDTLAPPTPPDEAVETQDWQGSIPSLWVNTYGITGYTDNLMGLLLNPPESIFVEDIPGVGAQSYPNPSYVAGSYPVTGFRVRMPGVIDADRNPLDKPVAASYSIIVPQDTMAFTVP